MADQATNFDQVSQSQPQKEVTVNAGMDALWPSSVYGRRASTCAALTWGYYGGNVLINGVVTRIANGTLTLDANSTCYIEADPSDGSVSFNTSGFSLSAGFVPLYIATTGPSTVTNYVDERTTAAGFLNGIAVPDFIGDSGSGGVHGLVPAPSVGDATKFLKGDGTWATVVAGGGSAGLAIVMSLIFGG